MDGKSPKSAPKTQKTGQKPAKNCKKVQIRACFPAPRRRMQ